MARTVTTPPDILNYNRKTWDAAVEYGSVWTIPVSESVIAAVRRGAWDIVLTPTRVVPHTWFPPLAGCRLLCLASGGGQQGPVLAAAGATVTVFDNSPKQLARDAQVAAREGISLTTVQGDMADLGAFADDTFDLIVHPCSNLFVPDLRPVWRDAWRVLRPGGYLLAGFANPDKYIFDQFKADEGVLEVRHVLPYSDVKSLTASERQQLVEDEQPLEWSHTLEDQIGGQIEAGFAIVGFYEDRWPGNAIDEYMATYFATRAKKVE
jgi:SAM-dependent methyltransferase